MDRLAVGEHYVFGRLASRLQRYRQRVEQADDMNLPDVAEALRPLLSQTQDHVMELRTALGR